MKFKIHTSFIKMLADLHTPVGIYNKVRDIFPNALLLESADYHDRSDSKSFICLEPIMGFEAQYNTYTYQLLEETPVKVEVERLSDIFTAFQDFVGRFEDSPNELPFNPQGLWGYSSFESVQYMEDIRLGTKSSEIKDNPDLRYQFFKYILVFDHFKNELYITQNEVNTSSEPDSQLKYIQQLIQNNNLPNFNFNTYGEENSNMSDEEYMAIVRKGVQHCKLGDTFQLVLSREFRQQFKGDDFNLYRCLRSINPSPYLFYFDYGDFKIFGSSPESQLQVFDGVAAINPIAGTVLRGNNAKEDQERAEELQQNPKERSEHVMLVDLARNDLSKSSSFVEIENYAEIQYFSHVIHMVSKVKGKLLPEKSGLDMYADTFPAGTLSGAPKYRALEIIGECEKATRNFYGGALGFIGFDGSVNHAIIIRSVLSKNNTLVYQAGAGIVTDSTPEGENQEVYNKIAAIRKAIQKANTL